MCGIFGIISDKKIYKEKLIEVSEVISHRGPDDEGFLLFNNKNNEHQCALGNDSIKELKFPKIESISRDFNSAFLHRRLSIIDLSSSGHQPMSYGDKNLWITLNGEIYNYIELKEELLKKGYKFKSSSDTEVVLAAYQEWGEECVSRFNGMWAFAIWDRKKNIVFLSRDRFGIKPLYYYFKNNVFVFCSEIKGIRKYVEGNLTLDEKQIYRFMVKGEIAVGETDETIYKEIKQLRAGNNLVFRNNQLFINKYWNLKLQKNRYTFNENVERLTELFSQSMKYRMRSDVEVGSCLSGGIDSSSIVSFGSKELNRRLHTFSAIWPGEKCDESYFMDKVNDKYNCFPHKFQPDTGNLLEMINQQVWHQELPLGGSSLIAQWSVMAEARKNNIKVLLDGQGADEILSGYPRYVGPYLDEMLFNLKWNEIKKHYPNLKENGYPLRRLLTRQRHKFKKYNSVALPMSKRFMGSYQYKVKYIPNNYISLPKYLKDEVEKSCMPTLLHYEDRNSMAHSIESRVPFLDYKLVEFAINIPSEQKISGTITKVTLREAMKPFLPVEVYNRVDKIGFSTPIEKTLLRPDSLITKEMRQFIKASELWKMDIVDKEILTNREFDSKTFALYSLAKFIELWA